MDESTNRLGTGNGNSEKASRKYLTGGRGGEKGQGRGGGGGREGGEKTDNSSLLKLEVGSLARQAIISELWV